MKVYVVMWLADGVPDCEVFGSRDALLGTHPDILTAKIAAAEQMPGDEVPLVDDMTLRYVSVDDAPTVYHVAALYPDEGDGYQRYATTVEANTPDEAELNALAQCREENDDPNVNLIIAAVIDASTGKVVG
jgi:hypothetical protein